MLFVNLLELVFQDFDVVLRGSQVVVNLNAVLFQTGGPLLQPGDLLLQLVDCLEVVGVLVLEQLRSLLVAPVELTDRTLFQLVALESVFATLSVDFIHGLVYFVRAHLRQASHQLVILAFVKV